MTTTPKKRKPPKPFAPVEEESKRKDLEIAADATQAERAMLAQMINLQIAGVTMEQIAAQTGHTTAEVESMITRAGAAYVRTQPALRGHVRNWAAAKYTQLLEANWAQATDPDHPQKFENQDRAIKVLDSMRKMFGADAPTQSEIAVSSAPEAVEKLVASLANQQGIGSYDVDVFDIDVVDVEEVDPLAELNEAVDADLEASAQAVEETVDGEDETL